MKLKKILSLFTIVALLFAGLLATPAFADENSWQATYPDLQTFLGILQYHSSKILPDGSTGWAHFDRGQVIYGYPWDVTSSDQEWKQATQTDRYGGNWQTANELDYQQAPTGSVVPGWQGGLQFQNDSNYAGPYTGQEPRYIGYDAGMNEVSNENFPIDTSGLIPPAQCVMIEYPWSNVSGDPNYPYGGSGWPSGGITAVPDYTWGIIAGALQNCYKTQFGFTAEADSFVNNPAFSAQNGGLSPTNIENYFELLTMPEPGITGSVRFWHNINGSPYYKTIEIPYTSLLPVYYAQSIDPFSGSPGVTTAQDNGTQYTGTVTFGVKPETIDSSNSDQTDVQLANLINLSLTASDILLAPIAVCVNSEDNYAAISTTDTTPYQPVSAGENCGGTGEGITLGSLTQGGVTPGAYTATFTWSVPSDFTGTSMTIGAGINDGYNDWDNETTDIIPDDITTDYADISEEYMIDDYTTVQVPVTGAPQTGGQNPGGNNPVNPVNPVNPINPSGYPAVLSFQAVNQANIKNMVGAPIGGTLKRGQNIALWCDSVTATLDASQQPDVSSYVPAGGVVTGVTWDLSDATLTYPAQHTDYSFGNPLEPTTTASTGITVSSDGHSATCTFNELWSEDGIGYGGNGPYGIVNKLTGATVAATPKSYQLSAAFTVGGTVSGYVPTQESNGNGGTTTVDVPFSLSFTIPSTAVQSLWIEGTDSVPMVSSGQLYMVGDTMNPQTHP